MNNKTMLKIALVVLAVGGLVLGGLYLLDALSWKTVRFTLSSQTESVTIYTKPADDGSEETAKEVANLTETGTVKLKTGSYVLVPDGPNVVSTMITAEVTAETTEIEVNPYYSKAYMAAQFADQLPAIQAEIEADYPEVNGRYAISEGLFYQYGEWYVTTMHDNFPPAREGVDVYAVILEKKGTNWQLAASPKLVFSFADHPDIPKDVVRGANRQAADAL